VLPRPDCAVLRAHVPATKHSGRSDCAQPGRQDSQESLESPARTATVKSALEQRILTGAFDDLAANAAAAAAAPAKVASSDASAAEAALLEAWRSRQLSCDRAADEVELGPMIGRGGFGQVNPHRALVMQSLMASIERLCSMNQRLKGWYS
jgi:hypothetical protein